MSDPIGHALLSRLDAMLAREVPRLRARYQLSLDEFRGLYVSDEQVDALLASAGLVPASLTDLPARLPDPVFDRLIADFGLSESAADLLLLGLAPDIDPRYATLIAYFNDDVRRRWPTIDLARRLLGCGEPLASALAPDGPLFGSGLLVAVTEADTRVPLPLIEFAANPVLTAFLLGRAVVPAPGIAAWEGDREPVSVPGADEAVGPLIGLEKIIRGGATPLVVLTGAGSDRSAAVRALARRLGRGVIQATFAGDAPSPTLTRDAILAARLAGALLLIQADPAALPALAPALTEAPVPVFLLASETEGWRAVLAGRAGTHIAFPSPGHLERQRLWAQGLRRADLTADLPRSPRWPTVSACRRTRSRRRRAVSNSARRLADRVSPKRFSRRHGNRREPISPAWPSE